MNRAIAGLLIAVLVTIQAQAANQHRAEGQLGVTRWVCSGLVKER